MDHTIDLEESVLLASKGGSPWHIALTQPQSEHCASAHLTGRRYRVYCPVFPKFRVYRGKKVVAYRPLFPGYMFVQLGANQDWHRLETAPGVQVTRSLLMLNGNYATVTPDELRLVQRTAKDLCEQIHEDQKPPQFHVGDEVKINVGQFAGFLARITTLDDDGRNIGLLTYLFGRECPVRAKPQHLTAA
jgi:transcriptional antiterminator RfaH